VRAGRRLARWALVASLALAAASCAQIPDSGAVRRGSPVLPQGEPALIQFQPDGPHRGDTPQQVVEGFLTAMQAYPPDSVVAREFLSPAADAGWEPGASTLIYTEHATSQSGGTGTRSSHAVVALRATRIASLSPRGSWMSAPFGGQPFAQSIHLVRVHGQWRIADPPAGTLVSAAYFQRYYRQYELYFLDPSHQILVPDPIYLPDAAQTPTLLVQGLLHGPTSALSGAVDSLVPASTQLSLSVPVSRSGVATVALSSDALTLGPEERQLLLAQLVWTLRQVSAVTGVRISAGGSPLDIPGSSGIASVDTLQGFDPAGFAASRQLVGLRRGRVVNVSGSHVEPVAGAFGKGLVPGSAVAVSMDGRTAAVVSADRRQILVGGIAAPSTSSPPSAPVVWYSHGIDLLRPSWDRTGRLWVVDRTRHGAQLLVLAKGAARAVQVPGLTGQDVRALRVSRDGVRLAAVVGSGDSARLLLGRIVRAGDGSVLAVDRVHALVNPLVRLVQVIDVGWNSPSSLVVLGRTAHQTVQPYVVAVDGSSIVESAALPAPGPATVAAAPNSDVPVVVGTTSGELWIRQVDLQWLQIAHQYRISSPAYPG
jgi:hypothetical protein